MDGVLKSNDASPLPDPAEPLCYPGALWRVPYRPLRVGGTGREEMPASDIDVLVEFREGEETFDHFMDLKFYLEDLLGRKTDLVIADTLKPRIRDAVLGEVVYAWRSPVVS